MPELPEVETIRRQLETKIIGKKIKNVEVRYAKLLNLPEKDFIKQVVGSKIVALKRRAKLLIWQLSGEKNLVFHLKMAGQVIWAGNSTGDFRKGKGTLIQRYTYIIFTLSDSNLVFFNDKRKFGWVKLLNNQELEKLLSSYGPEPLDKNFTWQDLKEILNKKKRIRIKPLLMDQTLLAGVGNIYAQEACFCAKILPDRKAGDIVDEEIKKLYDCLKKVLQESIKYHGTSADAYVDAFGRQGDFEPRLKVYGREGQKCFRCPGKVVKIKLGGRGTSYCPKCQI